MSTVRILSDEELSPEAAAVFADIRATRGTDFVNNVWRALAHDPVLLKQTWEGVRDAMAPREGGLDPLTKELVYLAVSVANACDYCAHSHTAAARAKGMTEAQYAEFLEIVMTASATNAVANAMRFPVDEVFKVGEGSTPLKDA